MTEREREKLIRFAELGLIEVFEEPDGSLSWTVTEKGYQVLRKEKMPGERDDH